MYLTFFKGTTMTQLGGVPSKFMSVSFVHVYHQYELSLYPLALRLWGPPEQILDRPVFKLQVTRES